jgi:putative serine protease PepD
MTAIPHWLWPAVGVAAAAIAIAALVIALLPDDDSTSATAAACPVTTIAENELPSVVTIEVAGAGGAGTGSGEIVDDDGHVLTNNHVIATAASGGNIDVVFNDGSRQRARLVGRDPQTDLAVLQVPETDGLRAIRFGSSEAVRVGQAVVALGAPLGLTSTVTAGIVSARDRSVHVPADNGSTALLVAAIQTDAAINPGNSGGALVDCAGRLIGVPTAGASVPTETGAASAGSIGLGFAIPADFAHSILQDLIAHGSVTHGFLGMAVDTTTAGTGLFVTAVTPGGPADHAGLEVGDVITELDGKSATTAEQLLELTLTHRAGDSVTITYERQGTTHETSLVLGSR